jgi:LmbE family N-acetylglucosaminyl deacetylase
VLDNHGGELLPTLEVRHQVIRKIREWNADLVLAPRPNDYHPDHRYTGVLVQDAAYMVVVPNVTPDTPPLRKNPVFMYFEDGFQKPSPFRPDVVVDITDVWDKKVDALDAHVSQVYEWLPWVDGTLDQVPKGAAERKKWLASRRTRTRLSMQEGIRTALTKWYGGTGPAAKEYEAFEVCEYGARPDEARLRQLFPMLGRK